MNLFSTARLHRLKSTWKTFPLFGILPSILCSRWWPCTAGPRLLQPCPCSLKLARRSARTPRTRRLPVDARLSTQLKSESRHGMIMLPAFLFPKAPPPLKSPLWAVSTRSKSGSLILCFPCFITHWSFYYLLYRLFSQLILYFLTHILWYIYSFFMYTFITNYLLHLNNIISIILLVLHIVDLLVYVLFRVYLWVFLVCLLCPEMSQWLQDLSVTNVCE